MDVEHLRVLRMNVDRLLASLRRCAWAPGMRVLEIGPAEEGGFQAHLPAGACVETLDIESSARPTFVADLTALHDGVPRAVFDLVVCTEVLEHTLDPFSAVAGLRSLLVPGGMAAVSTPFNFRIHGPLPDCWRFSEHGLRVLFRDFDHCEITTLECPGRPLMPIHYTLTARRPR